MQTEAPLLSATLSFPIDGTIVPVPPDFLHRLWSSFPREREKQALFRVPGGCSLQPVSTSSPLPTSFPLSLPGRRSGGSWLSSRGVLFTKMVMSLQSELRRQGDKLAESLRLPLSIFHRHLVSMSQVLPTLKLPTLAQEWAH